VSGLQLIPAPATVAVVPGIAERRILLTVQFDFDQYTIRSDSFETLNNLAIALNDPHLQSLSYEINGHTDLKGNFSHNIALSALRAKSVSDYLRGHGVLIPPIRAQGFGPLQLLYPTEPFNLGNRRVEVIALGS
jgi:outer membrane protein OmpA-like peptidoglycan-associated protein